MRASGYHTGLIGKCHLQSINDTVPKIGMPELDPNLVLPPEQLREADKTWSLHGRYDQELPSTWRNEPDFDPELPYYGFDHVELAIGHGDKTVGHYDRWLRARHPDPASLRGAQINCRATSTSRRRPGAREFRKSFIPHPTSRSERWLS